MFVSLLRRSLHLASFSISHCMFTSLRDAPAVFLNGCTIFNALCVSWLWRSLLMEKKLSKEEARILLINLRVEMLTW